MTLRYGSVCSGIEAATVAWHPLGWKPAFFSDIEAFPRAALRHHWPHVPVHGRDRLKGESFEAYADVAGFQTIGAEDYGPIDLLVGGTPCQSFSLAGKRGGMADGRGNLALEYIRLAYRKRARWVVWENVPGVFSSNGGEDFRCFLSGLVRWDVPIPDGGWRNAGCIAAGPADGAYGVAWRVLDAQFAGVPQRRRRVFVVGYLGDWRRAAAVLFERHSLSGHPAPRRQAGEGIAGAIARSSFSGGAGGRPEGAAAGHFVADLTPALTSSGRGVARTGETRGQDPVVAVPMPAEVVAARMVAFGEYEIDGTASTCKQRDYKDATDLVAHTLRAEGWDASEDGTGRGTPLVPIAFHGRASDVPVYGDSSGALDTDGSSQAVALPPVAIQERAVCENPDAGPDGAGFRTDGQAYTLEARTVPLAVCFTCKDYGADAGAISPTLRSGSTYGANGGVMPAVALPPVAFNSDQSEQTRSMGEREEQAPTLRAGGEVSVAHAFAVRRLTPRECERLQGFPDDHTRIPWEGWRDMDADETPDQCREEGMEVKQSPSGKWRVKDVDGPRYKALGNSMAVPVMRWIGERIQAVEDLRLNDAEPHREQAA